VGGVLAAFAAPAAAAKADLRAGAAAANGYAKLLQVARLPAGHAAAMGAQPGEALAAAVALRDALAALEAGAADPVSLVAQAEVAAGVGRADDAACWRALGTLLDADPRRALLAHLGHDAAVAAQQLRAYAGEHDPTAAPAADAGSSYAGEHDPDHRRRCCRCCAGGRGGGGRVCRCCGGRGGRGVWRCGGLCSSGGGGGCDTAAGSGPEYELSAGRRGGAQGWPPGRRALPRRVCVA